MKKKNIPMAGAIFLTAVTVLYELLLHSWAGGSFAPVQLIPLLLFAVGFGSVLGSLVSLLPAAAEKWTTVILSLLLVVAYMTELFLNESFTSFMPPKLIASGAAGVANGFMDVVTGLLKANVLRILLVLLPTILFALLIQPVKVRRRWTLVPVLLAAVCFAGGCGAVYGFNGSMHSLTDRYSFDSSVRIHGLAISTLRETAGSGNLGSEQTFVSVELPVVVPETQPVQAENPIAETEPVVRDPQVLDLDFAALAERDRAGAVGQLNQYVASLTPSLENEYTGLFKGKNLILITAEAFSGQVIDPVLTPALYRMANQGIRFTDFYQPGWNGGTTGGELANVSGLVPLPGSGMEAFSNQKPFITIGNQLMKLGYFSRAYHNNTGDFYNRDQTHANLGYEKFIAMYSGLEEGVDKDWPASDQQMVDFTLNQYIDHQPFSIYYMTVSGHCPYTDSNAQVRKNYDKVKDLTCSEPIKGYLAANLELEYAMETLLRRLEEAGIADDTVVVICADHYPYGLGAGSVWSHPESCIPELMGVDEKELTNLIRDRSAGIIWSGCLEGKNITVDTPAYSLDLLPTLCNLFDVDYDSRLLVGRDVFSDTPPLVLWPDHSWITEKGTYNSLTHVFTPADGAEASEEYIEQVSAVVQNKINYSHTALSNWYFAYLEREMHAEK